MRAASRDARVVRAALRRWVVLTAASAAATALSGCCAWPFEEAQSGFSSSRVVAMPARVAQAGYRLDEPLPPPVCKAVCGREECFPSSLVVGSDVASAVVVCNDYSPRSCSDAGLFRMPSGRRSARVGGSAASAFAALAAAEAGSVFDFDDLARALRRHQAPEDLVLRALRAGCDEVRHASSMRALASRAGGPEPTRGFPGRRRRATPSLSDLALENAVLGCVGETWGAFLLELGATRARDADVRRALSRIARDEARHAALAFAIHRWIAARLSCSERARVDAAIERALRKVDRQRPTLPAEVRALLGSPTDVDYEAVVPRLVDFVRAGTRSLEPALS